MNDLHASQACLDLIAGCEALRLTAYKPTRLATEPWTIGYGHTAGVCEGMTITIDVAKELLLEDVGSVEGDLRPLVAHCVLTQGMWDALVSLCFNLRGGPRALPHAAPKLWAALLAGRRNDAAAQFRDMDHEGHTELAGLHARRTKEAALFLS
jgi:lysozyme